MPRISTTRTQRLISFLLAIAGFPAVAQEVSAPEVIVSIADQKLAVVRDGELVAKYPVSTSKFGIGDAYGSYKTPLGRLRICEKIGENLPPGAVIKGRAATGEVLAVNAPGRDPIVTRILWLEGMEEKNRNARSRAIYIHGTPEEKKIGEPVSWGCIRMRSRDVVGLAEELPVGASVTIIQEPLPHLRKYDPRTANLLVRNEGGTPSVSEKLVTPTFGLRTPAPEPPLSHLGIRAPSGSKAAMQAMSGSILLSGLTGLGGEAPALPKPE